MKQDNGTYGGKLSSSYSNDTSRSRGSGMKGSGYKSQVTVQPWQPKFSIPGAPKEGFHEKNPGDADLIGS